MDKYHDSQLFQIGEFVGYQDYHQRHTHVQLTMSYQCYIYNPDACRETRFLKASKDIVRMTCLSHQKS